MASECDICTSRIEVRQHDKRELCRVCAIFETSRRLPGHCVLCGDPATGRHCAAHAWADPELEQARVYRDGFRDGRRSLNGAVA